jgi:hypothetical protein
MRARRRSPSRLTSRPNSGPSACTAISASPAARKPARRRSISSPTSSISSRSNNRAQGFPGLQEQCLDRIGAGVFGQRLGDAISAVDQHRQQVELQVALIDTVGQVDDDGGQESVQFILDALPFGQLGLVQRGLGTRLDFRQGAQCDRQGSDQAVIGHIHAGQFCSLGQRRGRCGVVGMNSSSNSSMASREEDTSTRMAASRGTISRSAS